MDILDIKSSHPYPSCALSNFHPYAFVIDGVQCASMEGFLQSLKFKSIKAQMKTCTLVGLNAKNKGKRKFLWKITGNIYWQGEKIKRNSSEFRALIDRAYFELFKNKELKQALIDSKNCELIHSIGKSNPKKTILTEKEFLKCLNKLRNTL